MDVARDVSVLSSSTLGPVLGAERIHAARLERYQLMMVVVSVGVVLLVASPLWLMRFKFGPLEWLWRSLTDLQRQPMRAREPVSPSWA